MQVNPKVQVTNQTLTLTVTLYLSSFLSEVKYAATLTEIYRSPLRCPLLLFDQYLFLSISSFLSRPQMSNIIVDMLEQSEEVQAFSLLMVKRLRATLPFLPESPPLSMAREGLLKNDSTDRSGVGRPLRRELDITRYVSHMTARKPRLERLPFVAAETLMQPVSQHQPGERAAVRRPKHVKVRRFPYLRNLTEDFTPELEFINSHSHVHQTFAFIMSNSSEDES
ncbi:hypothetical protein DPX16_8137 [Anabarilius grahami]|uniref:Uncharacterized protein n=1 Tax=Anabarilius grahami TaxID=495550 RepID=A0A3N0Y8H0_ANAGA|nr:hypothetical protein DPX16_8137 [Anabarilius grahami]